jgi:PilZ domain
MSPDGSKIYGGLVGHFTTTNFEDRRKSSRYPVIAEAKITDLKTESEFKARVSELCLDGCYVDFLTPLPVGSQLRLRITKDSGVFETDVQVVYTQPGMGFGIKFLDTPLDQKKVLERWIEELKAAS